ncbi:MAG: glucose-1-phosphate thymidylyltransferase, partial [Acidimicrobiia bacterium]
RQVGIVVGDTAPAIEAAVGDGSRFGLSVTYLRQEAPLGLAHAVLIARAYLGEEPFVMYLGDNLLVGGINAFVDEFVRERPAAQVLLTKVEHPENFGVAELGPDGRLVRLVEKPKEPKSDLALIGVYLFDASVHDAVAAIAPSWRGELEITDAIQHLLDTGHVVRPHVLEGPWIDTGKLQDLLEANRIVLESVEHMVAGSVDPESRLVGRVVVDEGAAIVRSVVRGPVALGPGCRIVDSYIGPYSSIGANCVVVDSEIEHSVILEGSRVEGVRRIEDSLIGRDALVCRSDSQPRAYRFMLSDHSEARVV